MPLGVDKTIALPPVDSVCCDEPQISSIRFSSIKAASSTISKEIASTLYLSQRTVEGHRTRVMQKMGVKSMAGLVTYACEKGLYGD